MDFEKSTNSFDIKKRIDYSIIYSKTFFPQFVNRFSALLCKTNILDIFNIDDFFQIFVIARNTKIMIKSHFWLAI